nr:uncharacterized mitochondrial protein AtMg00810-like [Tanacetum cinerariifolium]
MAAEVSLNFKYRGGQLNAAPVLEVENFTNWKKSIYKTEKKKYLVSATPLATAFFSTSIFQDFQDSLDDEEDTRSSQKYMDDLEEEYQARALLGKSKRFFKKDTQSFSQHKPELRPTKVFEAKYNKVKAKLPLLSLSTAASKALVHKSKGLIAEAYEWDEEEVSSNDDEMIELKVLMALADDNVAVSKEGTRNGEWVKISMRKAYTNPIDRDNKVLGSFLCVLLLLFPAESQRNTTNPLVAVTDSSVTDYDSTNKSSVCSTPPPSLEKLPAPAKDNKSAPASKINSALTGKLKNMKTEDDPPLAIIHNHKDHLGKFKEKADDGYLLGYSLVSNAFSVFNTRRKQTEETYHITFYESLDAIKFTKPLVDNINIAESERYPPNEYLHSYEPFSKNPKLNSTLVKDTLVLNIIPILIVLSSSIPSIVSPFPQDRWSQDKHIKLVNIISDPAARMLTRAMAKELNAASAHECLFVDFMSEEESKKSISINQEKYVKDMLKKYDINGLSVKTLMVPPNNIGPNLHGKAINETHYRGMIGSLMYLTVSRPDIQFSTCLCERYQANLKESHLIAVKRIFRYLKGTSNLGLWYPKFLGFDLKGYTDCDYVGYNMDMKITSCAYQLLGGKLVCWSAKKQQSVAMSSAEAEYVATTRCYANIIETRRGVE